MKVTFKYISIFVVFFFLSASTYSQCQVMSDLNSYHINGMSSTIRWTPQSNNSVICNSSDWQPSFFVNEDSLLNVRIRGEIFINSNTNDDDFVGFVFGYKSPTEGTLTNDNHFYLFDWKKVGQHAPSEYGGFMAREGFNLYYVNGIIPNDPVTTYQYFWGHEESENFVQLGQIYSNTNGWEYNTTYAFELIYTHDKIIISIDDEEIFNVDGCFSPGLFGLYSFNQNGAIFSNIDYEQYYDITFSNDQDVFCEERPIFFSFIDTNCTHVPPSLSYYEWGFGDGSPNSDELIPSHVYLEQGIFTVELKVTDINDCVDTILQNIFVEPKPDILSQPEDIQCFVGDAIVFSIEADYATDYQWYYQVADGYWSKLKNNGYFTGVTTSELHVFNVRPQFDLMKFRCSVDGVCYNPVTSQYAQIFITDIPIRASLGTSDAAVCIDDSTFLLITLKEFQQIHSANLRIIYNPDDFLITDFTTYFQNIDFEFEIYDDYLNISLFIDDAINLEEAIIASIDLRAIADETGSSLFSWDHENTFFLDFSGDTIQDVLTNSTILVHKAFEAEFNDTISLCKGDRLEVDKQLFNSVLWSSGDEGFYLIAEEEGDYWVHLVDRNSCISSDTFHIVPHLQPQAPNDIILSKPYFCSVDDSISFEIEGGFGAKLLFSYAGISEVDSLLTQTIYRIPNQFEAFDIAVSWSNICGISSELVKEIMVYESADLQVELFSDHTSSALGERITFTAVPENEGSFPNYTWLVDDVTKQAGTNTNYSTNELANYQKISVVLLSEEPCLMSGNIATATMDVQLESGPDLYVPGIVTPNGDGLNDSFRAVFRNIPVFHFSLHIFDIRGRLVYETTDMYDKWTARDIIRYGASEVYTYQIIYSKKPNPAAEEKYTVSGKFLLYK